MIEHAPNTLGQYVSRRAWFQLLLLAALWGAVYPLIVVALRELSPVLVVFGRVSLAALLLVPLAVRHQALRSLWSQPKPIIQTVLVQSTVPLLLLTYGQQYVSAGLAGILVGAQPLFVAVLAYRWAPEERPQGWQGVTGIVLGFAGLVVLLGFDLSGGLKALFGGMLVLAAALCYAAGSLMIHRRHSDAQPLGVATSAMIVTTAALLIPSASALPHLSPSLSVIGVMLLLGFACTGMTLVLFYTLITEIGPARAALGFYLSPMFAVLFGVIFLSEAVDFSAGVGLAAIIGGSVLASHVPESNGDRKGT